MEHDLKQYLLMGLGLIDYVKEKWGGLEGDLIRRGEERREDIRDFWDDLKENALTKPGPPPEEDSFLDEEEEPLTQLDKALDDLDVNGFLSGLPSRIGLANGGDVSELSDKLDRLTRAIENLEN